MFKIILLALAISLSAVEIDYPINNCNQFKIEAEKYVVKANNTEDLTMSSRYFTIAKKFENKFDNCVKMEFKGLKYNAYRKNPMNVIDASIYTIY